MMLNIHLNVFQRLKIPRLRILYLDMYPIFKFDYLVFLICSFFIYFLILDLHWMWRLCFVQLTVYFTLKKIFSFIRFHLLIVNFNSYAYQRFLQKAAFCTSGFKTIFYFLFHQVQCSWIYDVFDPLELLFCSAW